MNQKPNQRRQVFIRRLHLRTRGLSAEQARAAVAGLGEQILHQIHASDTLPPSGRIQVGTVHLVTRPPTPGSAPAELRQALAREVAAATVKATSTAVRQK